jgi:hypothetical protein
MSTEIDGIKILKSLSMIRHFKPLQISPRSFTENSSHGRTSLDHRAIDIESTLTSMDRVDQSPF